RSYDGHSGWASSRALALAGVTEATPDPKDGTVVREAGSTRPAGTLLEGAMDLVSDKIPQVPLEARKQAIVRALEHAARVGVTALCEVGDRLENLDAYEALDREGRLPVRVIYGPSIDDGIDAYAARRAALLARGSTMLRPGPLKGFVDGVVESNTAALLAPYADGSGPGAPAHLTAERIRDQVMRADRLGIDGAYHPVGDAAVRAGLDAVEAASGDNPPRDRRMRIEHVEVVSREDLPRFRALGVVASMMPRHADPGEEPDGGVWSQKVGPARLPLSFAFADLERAGARL